MRAKALLPLSACYLAAGMLLCGCGKNKAAPPPPLPHLYAAYSEGAMDTVLGWYSADRGGSPGIWYGDKCLWARYQVDSIVWLPRRVRLYSAEITPDQEALNRAAIRSALERDR